jgi:proteasome accessory factor B
MSEEPPLVRQWVLLRLLSGRRFGVTIKEMAQEMGVCDKTVRRDLETFEQAGFPLQEQIGEFGRKTWRLEGNSQPGLAFTFDEAIALYLSRRFLEPLAGTLFWEAAGRAFRKIRATLGPKALDYIERFGPLFHQTTVGASDYSKKADLIDQLCVGIEDRRAVFITYQSLQATEPVSYDVLPYGLAYHHGSLYLVGWSNKDNAIRHWKVDRITDAEVTQVPFQPPDGFDLKKHLATSFGIFHGDGDIRIKIRFSPTVARYVQESTWHESQQLRPQKDGSLLAEFRLGDTEEIKRWILSFGRHAVVVEPEELRGEIREEVEIMMTAYRVLPAHDEAESPRVPDETPAARQPRRLR